MFRRPHRQIPNLTLPSMKEKKAAVTSMQRRVGSFAERQKQQRQQQQDRHRSSSSSNNRESRPSGARNSPDGGIVSYAGGGKKEREKRLLAERCARVRPCYEKGSLKTASFATGLRAVVFVGCRRNEDFLVRWRQSVGFGWKWRRRRMAVKCPCCSKRPQPTDRRRRRNATETEMSRDVVCPTSLLLCLLLLPIVPLVFLKLLPVLFSLSFSVCGTARPLLQMPEQQYNGGGEKYSGGRRGLFLFLLHSHTHSRTDRQQMAGTAGVASFPLSSSPWARERWGRICVLCHSLLQCLRERKKERRTLLPLV